MFSICFSFRKLEAAVEAEDRERRRRLLGAVGAFLFVLLTAGALSLVVPSEPTQYNYGNGMDWESLFGPEVNPRKFSDLFRMNPTTFQELVEALRPWMAQNARDERYTSFEERIASTLFCFAHPNSQSGLEEVFHRSGSTISTTIHEVVGAIVNSLQLAPPSPPNLVEGHYAFHHMQGVIGALDGTHIPIILPSGCEPGAFRNRKGFLSQNVLVAVNFDLMATFVLTGSEGNRPCRF